MLTDTALKALKPKDKIYKIADRDGMYVRVMPSGAISFRLDYRLNGRRETVYLGRYGRDGISLALAREKCLDAKRAIRDGRSPAIEKQRDKRRIQWSGTPPVKPLVELREARAKERGRRSLYLLFSAVRSSSSAARIDLLFEDAPTEIEDAMWVLP